MQSQVRHGGEGRQRYSFREPGTYRIEPSFHAIAVTPDAVPAGQPTVYRTVWEGEVAAGPVVVTVTEPHGPEDSSAVGSIAITGEVVDAAGKPIPGVRVNVAARLTGGGLPANFVEHSHS